MNYSKPVTKNQITPQRQQIFAALVLTGILSISASVTPLATVNAAEIKAATSGELIKNSGDRTVTLPLVVANAVRQDLASKLGVSAKKLKITNFSQQTWSNGCLGLTRPDEFCAQVLVPGWRVVVSRGNKNWVYRTDRRGRVVRLEK